MKKINLKILFRKLIIFFLGLCIIQSGVAIFLQTAIGSDPFTIFTKGISKLCNINVGNGNLLLSFIFTFIIVFIFREIKQINIGTLIALLFAGVFINVMNNLIATLNLQNIPLLFKVILILLSCILIAIGFSLEKATDLGVAPNDLFILIFVDKIKLQYRWVRICLDILFVITGFLLCGIDTFGTTLGIGTIINAFTQGPLIQFFMDRVQNLVKPFITERKEN